MVSSWGAGIASAVKTGRLFLLMAVILMHSLLQLNVHHQYIHSVLKLSRDQIIAPPLDRPLPSLSSSSSSSSPQSVPRPPLSLPGGPPVPPPKSSSARPDVPGIDTDSSSSSTSNSTTVELSSVALLDPETALPPRSPHKSPEVPLDSSSDRTQVKKVTEEAYRNSMPKSNTGIPQWNRPGDIPVDSPLDPRLLQSHESQVGLTSWPNYYRATQTPPLPPPATIGHDDNDDSVVVTLVTQMTIDKWQRLHDLAERWGAAISCAVFIRNEQERKQLDHLVRGDNHENTTTIATVPPYVTLHVLYLNSTDPHVGTYRDVDYPMNRLRNLALDHATTNYVFPVDVDFLPSADSYRQIRELYHRYHGQLHTANTLLVLPAFEIDVPSTATGNATKGPTSKASLMASIAKGESAPFHLVYYRPGHSPTNYPQWYTSSAPYQVTSKPRFEPYFVARREGLPPYWDGLAGFYHDKISWVTELRAMGYRFYVAPETFVLHVNHPYKYRNNVTTTQCPADFEYIERFARYLEVKYKFPRKELGFQVQRVCRGKEWNTWKKALAAMNATHMNK